jgi:hypothetical protein
MVGLPTCLPVDVTKQAVPWFRKLRFARAVVYFRLDTHRLRFISNNQIRRHLLSSGAGSLHMRTCDERFSLKHVVVTYFHGVCHAKCFRASSKSNAVCKKWNQ